MNDELYFGLDLDEFVTNYEFLEENNPLEFSDEEINSLTSEGDENE